MKKLSYWGLTWLAFALAGLSACVNDPIEVDPYSGDDGEMQLWLDVVVPGGNPSESATRAITATEENTIQNIDVIAFRLEGGNETFDYWASATLAPGNTPGAVRQTFTANLRAQTYQQRFVVITNAHDQVNTTMSKNWRGASKATVLADLKYNLAAGQDRWNAASTSDYTRMPMWGESAPETVTATTTNLASTINLIRMVARIDVKLDTSVAGLTDQFKMKSVALYNTNTGGQIVPDAPKVVTEQRNGETYLRVNATTVPTELQPYSARRRGPINYTDFTAPGVTDVSMIGAIYTFEVANSTDPQQATAIVVGGLYGTDTSPSYYRVELWQQGSTTTRLDLLRNHQYVINITAVRGRGHTTAEEAFTSQAVNMTANILAWYDQPMDNVVFDSQYRLATDKDNVFLSRDAYTTALATGENTVMVTTDVPAGWTVNQLSNADGTGSPSWIRLSPTSGPANQNTQMVINADANTTGANRTAIATLAAGRLRLPVTIIQTTDPALLLRINNSAGQEIQELLFTSPGGVAPPTQSFTVNWQPITDGVAVTATPIGLYEFPNPGGNPAVQDGAPYNNMPWPERNGTRTFTVSPPAIATNDLTNDPFYERSTRFNMSVKNNYQTLTRSITLRQFQYNLRVEASSTATATSNPANALQVPYAPLGGRQYTYNVRSNSTWRITAVNETRQVDGGVSLLSSPGSTGDNVYVNAQGLANTTPNGGYKELFTTNNTRRGNAGFVDVTYSSDPSGRFTDVTQRIYIPSAPFVVYGITGMSGSTASTYNIYSGIANSSTQWHSQTMVNYAANFGLNINALSRWPLSTVFVPPVTVSGYNNNNSTTITTQQITDAVSAGADMLIISGSTTFDQTTSDAIYNQFLAKDKPVLLLSEDPNNMRNLFLSIRNAGKLSSQNDNMSWSTTGLNGSAPVYQFIDNAGDPLINSGKFRNLSGAYWGCDGNGSIAYWFSNSSGAIDNGNIVQYSNARNQSGNTDPLPSGLPSGATMDNGNTAFRFRNVPLIFAADGGYLGTFDPSQTTSSPSYISSEGLPTIKTGYGGGSTKRDVSNSLFVANVIGWAIQRRTTQ